MVIFGDPLSALNVGENLAINGKAVQEKNGFMIGAGGKRIISHTVCHSLARFPLPLNLLSWSPKITIVWLILSIRIKMHKVTVWTSPPSYFYFSVVLFRRKMHVYRSAMRFCIKTRKTKMKL